MRLSLSILMVCCLVPVPACATDDVDLGISASAAGAGASAPAPGLPIQNIGLPSGLAASGIPPLGMGVDPSSGTAGDGGGSGRITVASGWSGGPGAAAVYGEQLVVPLHIAQGAQVANTTCDVWNPNTGPGVVVTYELWSSNGGLLATNTIPASTSIVFRSWLQPASAITSDGGSYTLKLTPKNGDGSWTTSSAPITVISCAANAVQTLPIAAMAFVAEDPVHHPIDYIFGPAEGTSFMARAPVYVPVGHQIVAARVLIGDNSTDANAKMNLQLISINSNGTNVIASSPVSAGTGLLQTLAIPAAATTVQPHTAYFLHVYALGVPSAQDALWFAEVDHN